MDRSRWATLVWGPASPPGSADPGVGARIRPPNSAAAATTASRLTFADTRRCWPFDKVDGLPLLKTAVPKVPTSTVAVSERARRGLPPTETTRQPTDSQHD